MVDEVVTAFEFYNFPSTDYWYGTLCAISIFTSTGTQNQSKYGPYPSKSKCSAKATERVYGEIPSNISFQEFLALFSSTHRGNPFITMSSPPWKIRETITLYYGFIIDGIEVGGQLFGRHHPQSIHINLIADEVVTAFSYYNFPSTDSWYGTLCAVSIFTVNDAGIENQYGPYPSRSRCNATATQHVYGTIPSHMSFKEFLALFSSTRNRSNFITMSSPPWTVTTTRSLSTSISTATLITSAKTKTLASTTAPTTSATGILS